MQFSIISKSVKHLTLVLLETARVIRLEEAGKLNTYKIISEEQLFSKKINCLIV